MEFVDLKAQYRAIKESVDARIQRVLDHGQFILGPEVAELEQKLAAYTGSRHCVTCASGTEALRLAARHRGPIHLLFTDVVMAEVGGRDLARQLLARRPELKVLYTSGYTDDAIVQHLKKQHNLLIGQPTAEHKGFPRLPEDPAATGMGGLLGAIWEDHRGGSRHDPR